MRLVADAGPVIALAKIDRLAVVEQLFDGSMKSGFRKWWCTRCWQSRDRKHGVFTMPCSDFFV